MMKIIITMVTIFILGGCGICDDEPPKRAIIVEDNRYGMTYHIQVYVPFSGLSHGLGCTKYEYVLINIYSDILGQLDGDEILWKNSDGNEWPFVENGDREENIKVFITKSSVTISGFTNNRVNGNYKVVTTDPNSWNISIN